MEETEKLSKNFSGNEIAKNSLYNILGNVIPIIFAVLFIPPLIKGLGAERFGILSIAWMIIGYFSFFDFGIGKGVTKIIAEKIALNQTDQISSIFWTSLFLIMLISVVALSGLLIFIHPLVNVFNLSENLHKEAADIFYLLAFSIPIVTTMTALRGLLEAYQKFATINTMKVFLGMFTFLGPILALIITDSLFWVIFFLILIRIVIWILYLWQCIKVHRGLQSMKIDFNEIKPVLKFSIWITLGNIIVPLIFYSDRFLIGALISASAITFYITPYELVTKLMLIPDALSGVLFPVFSASFLFNPELSKKLFKRGAKFIFLVLYPMVFFITTFAFEILDIWLGIKFAQKSYLILQFLAIGVLMNCISLIPTNFLQGIGKPKIITLIVLVELPFYLSAMWFAIDLAGINGAALVFMVAATINVSILYFITYRYYEIKFDDRIKKILILVMFAGLMLPFIVNGLVIKILLTITFIPIFVILSWKLILNEEERLFVHSKLRMKIIS